MKPFPLVAVGCSLGGMEALQILLKALPADFRWPVAVVLHRDTESDIDIIRNFMGNCPLKVKEAEDKEPAAAGCVYFAPADYHLLVEADGHFALSTDAPIHHARPAIDVLFESMANACRNQAVAVVLTGSSQDGAAGLARIKECGGVTVVQDPATAENSIMPVAALALMEHKILPLQEIGQFLIAEVSNAERGVRNAEEGEKEKSGTR